MTHAARHSINDGLRTSSHAHGTGYEILRVWVLQLVAFCAVLAGCASNPQTLAIPRASEELLRPSRGTKNYPEVVGAIMSYMVRELKLPNVDGVVIVYPSQVAYEEGVVAESERDIERIKSQLGQAGNQIKIEEVVLAARRMAVSSVAVGMYRKILVNDSRAGNQSWSGWVRVLAHELTHSAEREIVGGRFTLADQWVREGFADWVGYKVVEAFGGENLASGREQVLKLIANAKAYQTFPSLSQLGRNLEWTTWLRNRGHAATYGQAFIAVDFLIEQRGVAAVTEYFRMSGTINDRERNFGAAFGESLPDFEKKFEIQLQTLLQNTKTVI